MQQTDDTPKQGTSRWVKALLVVSIALNLAVVGLVAGVAMRGDGPGNRAKSGPGLGAFGAPYMIALPRQERRAIFRAVKSSGNAELPNRAARRAMYANVLSTLRETPFDAGRLRDVVGAQSSTSVAVQQTAQAAWIDVISNMSDAERRDYAEAVEEVLRRGPKRR